MVIAPTFVRTKATKTTKPNGEAPSRISNGSKHMTDAECRKCQKEMRLI